MQWCSTCSTGRSNTATSRSPSPRTVARPCAVPARLHRHRTRGGQHPPRTARRLRLADRRAEARDVLDRLIEVARRDGAIDRDVTSTDIALAIIRFCRPLAIGLDPVDDRAIAHRQLNHYLDGLMRSDLARIRPEVGSRRVRQYTMPRDRAWSPAVVPRQRIRLRSLRGVPSRRRHVDHMPCPMGARDLGVVVRAERWNSSRSGQDGGWSSAANWAVDCDAVPSGELVRRRPSLVRTTGQAHRRRPMIHDVEVLRGRVRAAWTRRGAGRGRSVIPVGELMMTCPRSTSTAARAVCWRDVRQRRSRRGDRGRSVGPPRCAGHARTRRASCRAALRTVRRRRGGRNAVTRSPPARRLRRPRTDRQADR